MVIWCWYLEICIWRDWVVVCPNRFNEVFTTFLVRLSQHPIAVLHSIGCGKFSTLYYTLLWLKQQPIAYSTRLQYMLLKHWTIVRSSTAVQWTFLLSRMTAGWVLLLQRSSVTPGWCHTLPTEKSTEIHLMGGVFKWGQTIWTKVRV